MNIKRVFQGTALTAFAAIAWFGDGSANASASVSIQDVVFDEEDISLEVQFSDTELMAGIANVDKKRKAKVTAWDVYEPADGSNKGQAKIDLSKFNVTKDNYIAIMTNDMTIPLYIKVAAAAKKNSITFLNSTARISEFKADGKSIQEIDYRRATDAWGASGKISELDFSEYQYQGAALYVRKKGINELSSAAGDYEKIKNGQVSVIPVGGTKEVSADVYNIGSLPGKETKLNIAKQANGPSVSVDYKKGTVTINKSLEYRVIKESGTTTYNAVGSKEVKAVAGLLEATETAPKADTAILEVRKAAATNGKGKCASKWTRVKIENPKELLLDSSTKDIKDATIEQPVIISTSAGAIMEAGYKLNNKQTEVTNLVLTNKCEDNYEYYLGSSVPAAGDKAIKPIRKGKTINIKKGDVSGKNIYIRLAGDKKSKRWAGAWKQIGTNITIPSVAASK
ncbi:MAG: hypothetical protein K1W06_04245 [Lachnospiraceae bacterium]